MATYAPNQLHLVPLAELQPDPTQPQMPWPATSAGALQNKIGNLC